MIKRQRRKRTLALQIDARTDPGRALQRVGDQVAMRQHRALGDAGRAAGILQQRHRVRSRLGIRVVHARHVVAGILQHRELCEMPRRDGVLDVGIRQIEGPALEQRREIAKPRHDDVLDLRVGDNGFQLMGEILQNHDDAGAGISQLLFQLTRRVERIDIDGDHAGAQCAEERDRIGEQVRQHDGDTVARPAARLFDEERREAPAGLLPLCVTDARAQTFEGRPLGKLATGFEQHGVQRRIGAGIDRPRHARGIRREPGRFAHDGRCGRRHRQGRPNSFSHEGHGFRSSAGRPDVVGGRGNGRWASIGWAK